STLLLSFITLLFLSNAPATSYIYTLSLHDALPIFFITPTEYDKQLPTTILFQRPLIKNTLKDILALHNKTIFSIAETEKYAHVRSEEHTSELQSRGHLVCRLLLEKKKKKKKNTIYK